MPRLLSPSFMQHVVPTAHAPTAAQWRSSHLPALRQTEERHGQVVGGRRPDGNRLSLRPWPCLRPEAVPERSPTVKCPWHVSSRALSLQLEPSAAHRMALDRGSLTLSKRGVHTNTVWLGFTHSSTKSGYIN